jgi:hypothetical protein
MGKEFSPNGNEDRHSKALIGFPDEGFFVLLIFGGLLWA